MQELERDIKEIKEVVQTLQTDIALVNSQLKHHGDTIEKLSETFTKLTQVIEHTQENKKDIEILFKRIDRIEREGTQQCPVNAQRLISVEKRIEKLNSYLMGVVMGIAMQIIALIVYLIERHII